MGSTTSTANQKQEFIDLLSKGFSEAGESVDASRLDRVWDYLQSQQAHVHIGSDTDEFWREMAQSSVQNTAKGNSKMIRIATQDRDGGFAYVCLGDKAASELIQSLEQSLQGGRR